MPILFERRSSLFLLVVALVAMAHPSIAQDCAKTPEDAWRLAREAVATKDAGKVMMRLSPAYQTQNAVESAISASMLAEMRGMVGGSPTPAAEAKAQKIASQLLAELDRILKKYKAMTIKEIGTPRMAKMRDPAVIKRFSTIDHVGFAREIDSLFAKIAAAEKAATGSGESVKLDEYVVGGGDMNTPLTDLTVTSDTAKATAGQVTMLFRRINGCWVIDGRE